MLFLANFDPRPLSHFVTYPGTPESIRHTFSRPSTKYPNKGPLYKFYLNCSRGFLSEVFCQGVFCLEGIVQGGFVRSPSVRIHLGVTYFMGGPFALCIKTVAGTKIQFTCYRRLKIIVVLSDSLHRLQFIVKR